MLLRALLLGMSLVVADASIAATTSTTATKTTKASKKKPSTSKAAATSTTTGTAAAGAAASSAAASTAANATDAAAPQTGIAAFLNKIETARGKALSIAEKGQITTLTQEGKGLLDKTQDGFISKVSGLVGMDPAITKALFPQAAQPVSGSDAVGKLEEKLGRKLSFIEGPAVKAAASLRNNSLDSAKGTVAEKVGGVVGMDKETVLSLLPLVGL